MECRAGRNSHQEPCLPGKPGCAQVGIGVGHPDHLIVYAAVKDLRYKAGADALYLVGPRFTAGQNRRVVGLDGRDVDCRVMLLKDMADSGYGASGTDPCHETVDGESVHCAEDFRTCGK